MSNIIEAMTYEVSGSKIELQPETVKNYLVRGNGNVSDQEVMMFMNLCQYQKLNPLINEAYLIKFGQQPAQIIVSKEAFMKRAESHEEFEGFEAGVVYEFNEEIHHINGAIMPKKAELLGGWCKVYRNDRQKPIEVQVSLKEFSKGQATWKEMPLNMIRKVAIVNALREAFPNSLGAMYTEEESQKQEVPHYQPERKDITPNEAPQTAQHDQEVVQAPLDVAKAQMKAKFEEMNITTNEAMTEYIQKHAKPKGKKPTLSEMHGLLKIMDIHIEEMNSTDNDGLE